MIKNDHCSVNSEKKGIYVVWDCRKNIQDAIFNAFIDTSGEDYCAIRINLSKYKIKFDDIAPDFNGGEDDLNKACFKILKDIPICEDDIQDYTKGNGDINGETINELEGYYVGNKPSDYNSDALESRYRSIIWSDEFKK